MCATVQSGKARFKPFVSAAYCKSCGRCIAACPKGCISLGGEVNHESGFVPVKIDYTECIGCGICASSCPEPYALHDEAINYYWENPKNQQNEAEREVLPQPEPKPAQRIPLPKTEPLMIKGTYASAIGALLAGCRHFFGYPITPSTEGSELMAKILPHIKGTYIQAVSEVAAINYIYGCGGAGVPCMTFTSSPGYSLMQEGLSCMVAGRVPGVIVNIMRGGPGLGNIGPEQADIKFACRGLGHGNTHALVLAPSDPQEMLNLTMEAFEKAFKYRLPVIVLGDGYLGQVTGSVKLPEYMIKPGTPEWAVAGDREHRANLITSLQISEADLERENIELEKLYEDICANEQRADLFNTEGCEILLVAANTPARMAKGAIRTLRSKGIKAGLFRPVSLWPFPIDRLKALLEAEPVKHIMVVEASLGQLEDEMRLALSYTDVKRPPISHVRRLGGVLPSGQEIVAAVEGLEADR